MSHYEFVLCEHAARHYVFIQGAHNVLSHELSYSLKVSWLEGDVHRLCPIQGVCVLRAFWSVHVLRLFREYAIRVSLFLLVYGSMPLLGLYFLKVSFKLEGASLRGSFLLVGDAWMRVSSLVMLVYEFHLWDAHDYPLCGFILLYVPISEVVYVPKISSSWSSPQ